MTVTYTSFNLQRSYLHSCKAQNLQLKFTIQSEAHSGITQDHCLEERKRMEFAVKHHVFVLAHMSLNCIPHEHCKASINNRIYFTSFFNPLRSLSKQYVLFSVDYKKGRKSKARRRQERGKQGTNDLFIDFVT